MGYYLLPAMILGFLIGREIERHGRSDDSAQQPKG